jgi:CRISPR-associated protein Csc3
MKYNLIENYFSTELFQETVQSYFDTVLGELFSKHSIVESKGLFIRNGKELKNDYDMPYHIHILNGLIPSLLIYEKYLIEKTWIDNEKADVYLKVFMLGFTFHDANKLLKIDNLQTAIQELDITITQYSTLKIFFSEFEQYKNDIYFLCLSDEDRTSVLANRYKITLSETHLKETLALLCKFADSIASIQKFETIEQFYNVVSKTFRTISGFNNLSISYVEVSQNPYILLSQNILQSARMVLAESGKKVFQSLRNGFIFFGEDITEAEVKRIEIKSSQVSSDIDPVGLTKIDAQKCNFGFVGSVGFTKQVLEEIINKYIDKFFALSPNGRDKIANFDDFVELNKKLIEIYGLPILVRIQDNKLYLNVDRESEEDWHKGFFKLFALHKIQWLNIKQNPKWDKDFKGWGKKEIGLISQVNINDGKENKITICNTSELINYIKENTKSSNALLKTYLNITKSYSIIEEKSEEEIEEYITQLEDEIITSFTGKLKENNLAKEFFYKYFNYRGNDHLSTFKDYNPQIPEKGKMCAFTGGVGLKEYKEDVAFSMKARGFSNRTITSLNNNKSHISDLFSEENKLRKSNFKMPDANILIYHDFFETTLDINRDILTVCVKAKNIKVLEDASIQFDKNAKFIYNLYNLNFDKIPPSIESNFYFVRKLLLMVKTLGVRSYVTGIMSPYAPHKECFKYENAPRFLQLLEWDKVRLMNIDNVLEEISLILTFGSGRLSGNLLKVSEDRNAYFTLYYLLKEDDKKKVYDKLKNFITNNFKLFSKMTITENLAEVATKITLIGYNSSGSEETWLIRKALEYVRREVKQGYKREDVIQRISGNIYKTMRLDYVNIEVIQEFATAVYDQLYVNEWKQQLPNLNREKDWIYQFAFLYREKSLAKIDLMSANKIKQELEKEKKSLTEESIREYFKKNKKEKYADKYINLILNKK